MTGHKNKENMKIICRKANILTTELDNVIVEGWESVISIRSLRGIWIKVLRQYKTNQIIFTWGHYNRIFNFNFFILYKMEQT